MKLALILPPASTIQMVRSTLSFITLVDEVAKALGTTELSLAVGVPSSIGIDRFKVLIEGCVQPTSIRVVHREYTMESVDSPSARRMFPKLDFDFSLINSANVARDWGWNFTDCDVWFVAADPSSRAVMPLKPAYLLVHDLRERYDPHSVTASPSEMLDKTLTWRQYAGLIAFDHLTAGALVSYIGAPMSHVHLWPAPDAAFAAGAVSLRKPATSKSVYVHVEPSREFDRDALATVIEDLVHDYPDISVVVGVDAIAGTRQQIVDGLSVLEAKLADSKGKHCQIKPVRSIVDLTRLVAEADVLVSMQQFPGRDLLIEDAVRHSKLYVGHNNPSTVQLCNVRDVRGFYWDNFSAGSIYGAITAALSASLPSTTSALQMRNDIQQRNLIDTVSDLIGRYVTERAQ